MNSFARAMLALVAGAALAACAAAPLAPAPGVALSPQGLQRMTGTKFDEVWIRPGFQPSRYAPVVLESTGVSFREVQERPRLDVLRARPTQDVFPVPAAQRARIVERFEERLVEAVADGRRVTVGTPPGPGALTVRAGLVDFVSHVPAEEPLVRNVVSSVGEATLVVEFWDMERGELLLHAVRHGRIEPLGPQLIRGNDVASWPELDRQLRRWSEDVRVLLDTVYSQGGF